MGGCGGVMVGSGGGCGGVVVVGRHGRRLVRQRGRHPVVGVSLVAGRGRGREHPAERVHRAPGPVAPEAGKYMCIYHLSGQPQGVKSSHFPLLKQSNSRYSLDLVCQFVTSKLCLVGGLGKAHTASSMTRSLLQRPCMMTPALTFGLI